MNERRAATCFSWILIALAAAALAAACGDDLTPAQKCAELGELCHDTTTELGQICHDIGHDEDLDACEEMYDECHEECEHGH